MRQNVNINLTNTKTVINAHHKSIICSSYLVQDQTNALKAFIYSTSKLQKRTIVADPRPFPKKAVQSIRSTYAGLT